MAELHSPELPLCLIQYEILPRLPARSVGRFKCVCKQWNSFLSTRKFSKMHRDHVTHHKLLILDHQHSTFHTLDCEALNRGSTAIPFEADPHVVFILGSLDGLVCLASLTSNRLAFWNPLTGAYKKLSNNSNINSAGSYNIHFDAIGFYIDSSNDYKLLHIVYGSTAYIYSQRLDSWRKIDFLENTRYRFAASFWSQGTFCGQSLYFTVTGGYIISFDVNTETFRVMQLPPIPDGAISYCGTFVILNDCIRLYLAYSIERNFSLRFEADLWRIEDGGDMWVKVTSFPAKYKQEPYMICIARNMNWLAILEDNNSFYKINMEDFTSYSWCLNILSIHDGTIYVETLVSPNP